MADPKLQAVVTEMRAQLAQAEGLEPATRRSLEHLVRDLEALAAEPEATRSPAGASIRDRTAEALRRVEASHPTLSNTLGNVVDALAFFNL